ncbi:glycosyltransferase family 2 protein [Halosimplex halobium]|uniref:glycosyltransferase family 2 protein n=1 Tax=Halosimplex halobium TaxID=3396618 RepID=UPI003F57F22E
MTTVSVCIITVGRDTLPAALQSVREQNLDGVEVLVGHADRHEYVRRLVSGMFPERGRTVRAEGSIPEARNTLLDAAKGDYIAVLDDDDRMCPGRLEYQRQVLEETETVLVGQLAKYRSEIGPDGEYVEPKEFHAEDLEDGCALFHSSVMFENRYRYRPKFSLCEDYDLFLRILDDVGESGVQMVSHDLAESRAGHGSTVERHRQLCTQFGVVAQIFHRERQSTGGDSYEAWDPARTDWKTEPDGVSPLGVLGLT